MKNEFSHGGLRLRADRRKPLMRKKQRRNEDLHGRKTEKKYLKEASLCQDMEGDRKG